METKTCFKCKSNKTLDDFYRHSRMADGHLNKCKECTKLDVREHYRKRGGNVEYERKRSKRPERKAAQVQYQRDRRRRHPDKAKAWNDVSRAIRTGKLQRQPCEVCGNANSQAHHHDYSKPLDVRWLCFKHHRELEHGQAVRIALTVNE